MFERSTYYYNCLEQCEEELRTEAWKRAQERVKEQRALLDKQREQIRQKWRADNQQAIKQQVLELRRSSHELLLAEQEAQLVIEQDMARKFEEYQIHDEISEKRLSDTMEMVQQAKDRSQERRRRRSVKCMEIKDEAMHLLKVLGEMMKSCKHPQHLADNVSKMADQNRQLLTKTVSELDHMIRNQSATKDNITERHDAITTVASSLGKIKVSVEMANKKGDEELKLKQEQEEKEKQKLAEKKAKEDARKAAIAASVAASNSPVGRYNNAVTAVNDIRRKIDSLKANDPEFKRLRPKLLAFVNHAVNAICPQSQQHLLDKVQRLKSLLNGQVVVTTDRRVSTREHAMATEYCVNELTEKIVRQGETQVSSKPEAAFAVAAVAVAMASAYPRVKNLMLCHFHSICPVLVPFYIPKPSGVSEEDHKRMQGYKVVGGALETEDNYYKRISGIVRLYAAIIQYPVPKEIPHPLGPEHGWEWLANILNDDPRSGITATALLHFLEVAGHRLLECYGKQFIKMMSLLSNEYMPKIEAVTGSDQKASVARLQMFIEQITKAGKIPKPPGHIPVDLTRT